MHFSLGEAAKHVTASKSTIRRAIESGKLSAEKEANGFRIEAAELFRVFPPLRPTGTPEAAPDQELSEARAEVEKLRAEARAREELLDEVRSDRDHWRDHAKQLQIGFVKDQEQREKAEVATEKATGLAGILKRLRG